MPKATQPLRRSLDSNQEVAHQPLFPVGLQSSLWQRVTEAREGEALAGVRVHEKEISLYVFLNYSVHIVFVQAVVGLSVVSTQCLMFLICTIMS